MHPDTLTSCRLYIFFSLEWICILRLNNDNNKNHVSFFFNDCQCICNASNEQGSKDGIYFIYELSDVAKITPRKRVSRYWDRAPPLKKNRKNRLLRLCGNTRRRRTWTFDLPRVLKSVIDANLISREVIGKTMFLYIIDRISQNSLKIA